MSSQGGGDLRHGRQRRGGGEEGVEVVDRIVVDWGYVRTVLEQYKEITLPASRASAVAVPFTCGIEDDANASSVSCCVMEDAM